MNTKIKMDILWFSNEDWLECISVWDQSNYGGTFGFVLDFEKDYAPLNKTILKELITNFNKYLTFLASESLNNDLPKPWFKEYFIESLNSTIYYKVIGKQSHVPEIDSLVKKFKQAIVENKNLFFYQIDMAEAEAIGSVCTKIVKRNLKLNTLSDKTKKRLLDNELIFIKNNTLLVSNKMKILFGRGLKKL